jgi:hypothetical protein
MCDLNLLLLPLFLLIFDHFFTSQCGDSLLMIGRTQIYHVISVRISHQLTLKLFFSYSFGIVDDLFKVSFHLDVYLGKKLSIYLISLLYLAYKIQNFIINVRIRQERWLLLVLLWPKGGRWLLFMSFFIADGP